jgi:hypothetical protein
MIVGQTSKQLSNSRTNIVSSRLRVALTVHILTPTSNLHRILIRALAFLQYLWEVSETQGERPTANFDRWQRTIESMIVTLKTDR